MLISENNNYMKLYEENGLIAWVKTGVYETFDKTEYKDVVTSLVITTVEEPKKAIYKFLSNSNFMYFDMLEEIIEDVLYLLKYNDMEEFFLNQQLEKVFHKFNYWSLKVIVKRLRDKNQLQEALEESKIIMAENNVLEADLKELCLNKCIAFIKNHITLYIALFNDIRCNKLSSDYLIEVFENKNNKYDKYKEEYRILYNCDDVYSCKAYNRALKEAIKIVNNYNCVEAF